MQDDATGTYTGVAWALIENGADMSHHMLANYSLLEDDEYETGTGHGSFVTAREKLGAWHRLGMYLGERVLTRDVFTRLCTECRALPTFNAQGKVGMVVIDPQPQVDYRATSNPFSWHADVHFLGDTFRCGRTSIDDVYNHVTVEFDYSFFHEKFMRTTFVHSSRSDDGTGYRDEANTREPLAAQSVNRFGVQQEYRVQCPEIRHQGVAKAIRNYLFDSKHRTRVWAEFETGLNACDLSVGNVIRFADEKIAGVYCPNPDGSTKHWSEPLFYVGSVTRVDSALDVPRYRVRALEAIEPDVPGDWIANEDEGSEEEGDEYECDSGTHCLWHLNSGLLDSCGTKNLMADGTPVYASGKWGTDCMKNLDSSGTAFRGKLLFGLARGAVTNYTMGAWVKTKEEPEETDTERMICGEIGSSNYMRLYRNREIDSESKWIAWEIEVGGGVIRCKYDATKLGNPTGWHHVMGVLQSVGSTILAKLYIDGALRDTQDTDLASLPACAGAFYVGGATVTGDLADLETLIEEVRISTTARNPNELFGL